MIYTSIILATDPTPVITTLSTMHMPTASILFDWNFAFRAFVSPYFVSPAFIILFLCCIAWLPRMPLSNTLKTKIFLAWWTLDLFSILLSFDHNRTAWVWTESLFLTHHYFMILLKILEFEVSISVNDLLKKFISNFFLTSLLRTYKFIPLSWLFDLIFKKFLVGSLAKCMTTWFHCYELIQRVILIAYFTKFSIFNFFLNDVWFII